MQDLLQLAKALQVVHETKIEFKPDCFVELAGAKLEAFRRKMSHITGRVYEVVVLEPTVIERVGNERLTLELSTVTESERRDLLNAVKFVYRQTKKMRPNATFQDRLKYHLKNVVGLKPGDLK